MSQSLDGYIAGPSGRPPGPPDPIVFRHFADHVRGLNCILYGRRMYEVMRYWEEDKPDWDEIEDDFALAWRPKQKWVASRALTSLGPNATLVQGDLNDFVAKLKSEREGEIGVSGAELAGVLSAAASLTSIGCTFVRTCSAPGNPTSPVPCLRFAC